MKTRTCLGCDCEVACQGEDTEDSFTFYCDSCGHYKAEKTVLALYDAQRQNNDMKKKLQKRLFKTKDCHNRIITTKKGMKKVKKDEISYIITLDESNPNTIELWKVQNFGSVSKISLDDEREQ